MSKGIDRISLSRKYVYTNCSSLYFCTRFQPAVLYFPLLAVSGRNGARVTNEALRKDHPGDIFLGFGLHQLASLEVQTATHNNVRD